MEKGISVEYTIPIWIIVTYLISWIGTAVWVIVKLFFSDKKRADQILNLKDEMTELKGHIDSVKNESNIKIAEIKTDIDSLKLQMGSMRDILIEVRTHTTLILSGSIEIGKGGGGKK